MQTLGHDGPPTNLWTRNLLTDEPLARCPVRTLQLAREASDPHVREADRYVETYHPAYTDKHLLIAGGIADQPARYVELVQLIGRINHQVDAKYAALTKENAK
jgi:hypothetical protein